MAQPRGKSKAHGSRRPLLTRPTDPLLLLAAPLPGGREWRP